MKGSLLSASGLIAKVVFLGVDDQTFKTLRDLSFFSLLPLIVVLITRISPKLGIEKKRENKTKA